MKGRVIGFWVTTAITAVAFGVGGAMDAMVNPQAAEIMKHLGYPLYVAQIIGVFKLVGVGVLLAPGLARAKEWAYAGMAIDLLGASASHTFSGDGPKDVVLPLVIAAIAAASWALRPSSRVMGQLFADKGAHPAPGAAT